MRKKKREIRIFLRKDWCIVQGCIEEPNLKHLGYPEIQFCRFHFSDVELVHELTDKAMKHLTHTPGSMLGSTS